MSVTTEDLFQIIGQKETRIYQLNKDFATVQKSNIQFQESLAALQEKHNKLQADAENALISSDEVDPEK